MARKIIHLIPYDGIGGVETAAATAEGAMRGDLRLERMFIVAGTDDREARRALRSPLALWRTAGWLARANADLVILSLWRSILVWMLARLRGHAAPSVLFLHNSRDAHLLDRWLTRFASSRVEAIWADSQATLEQRLVLPQTARTRVISYLTRRISPTRGQTPDPAPDLVFWGRLSAQKDPVRLVRLFALVHEARTDARLTMIGPDGGLRADVESEIAARGLEGAVTLIGPADHDAIARHAGSASFYLQTSRYEGMALSVMEAMQLGLVPVVTPVGEIARYTQDGKSAIWVAQSEEGDEAAAAAILDLLGKPDKWRKMQAAALSSWAGRTLYADDVLLAAEETLNAQSSHQAGREGTQLI